MNIMLSYLSSSLDNEKLIPILLHVFYIWQRIIQIYIVHISIHEQIYSMHKKNNEFLGRGCHSKCYK